MESAKVPKVQVVQADFAMHDKCYAWQMSNAG